MNFSYKTGANTAKFISNVLRETKQKIQFSESDFSQNFSEICSYCYLAVYNYNNNDTDISEQVNELNSFFGTNKKQLYLIDLLPVTNLYKDSQFDRLIFEIFNNENCSQSILDLFILHLDIILDFMEFQEFFKTREYFQCIFKRFLNYQGEKGELFILSLMKLFQCQYQYEGTYSSIFNNFNNFSHVVFNFTNNPIYNYQFSDLIITYTNSKDSVKFVDQKIISEINLNHQNIINNLPPFDLDNNSCLILLYHICRKIVKNDSDKFIGFLNSIGKLEILLSPPVSDTKELRKCRIDFFRICLQRLEKESDKRYLLNNNKFDFDYPMIIQCAQEQDPDSRLFLASLKFFSAFVPLLIEELFNQKRYTEEAIIDFVDDILCQGKFKEKKVAINFLTSLINANNNNKFKFIRTLLNADTNDEKNIFISFNNLMQSDDDNLKIEIFKMIQSLFKYFQSKSYKRLMNQFISLLGQSGLEQDFNDHLMSENEEIRAYANDILVALNYQKNITENQNF